MANKMTVAALLALFSTVLPVVRAAECDLSPISIPTPENIKMNGQPVKGYELLLEKTGELEDKLAVKDQKTSRSCVIQDLIVSDQMFVTGNRRFLVVPGAGFSNSWVNIYDLSGCRLLHEVKDTGIGVWTAKNRLIYPGQCQPVEGNTADCDAAGVVRLTGPACAPALIESDSRALTKIIRGVEFLGSAVVEAPSTDRARLAEPGK